VRRGRPLREALGLLATAALPDPYFADDMEAVLGDVGPLPDDPWARSLGLEVLSISFVG
jgi:hypothetical protein